MAKFVIKIKNTFPKDSSNMVEGEIVGGDSFEDLIPTMETDLDLTGGNLLCFRAVKNGAEIKSSVRIRMTGTGNLKDSPLLIYMDKPKKEWRILNITSHLKDDPKNINVNVGDDKQ